MDKTLYYWDAELNKCDKFGNSEFIWRITNIQGADEKEVKDYLKIELNVKRLPRFIGLVKRGRVPVAKK